MKVQTGWGSGKVHDGRKSTVAGGNVLACTGRFVHDAVRVDDSAEVTCKACEKKAASR